MKLDSKISTYQNKQHKTGSRTLKRKFLCQKNKRSHQGQLKDGNQTKEISNLQFYKTRLTGMNYAANDRMHAGKLKDNELTHNKLTRSMEENKPKLISQREIGEK